MEKTQHFFENGIYLISNHAVARNRMFEGKDMQVFFQQKMEKHLSPICEIFSYCLNDDEFQILVKLRSRDVISRHFLSKKRNRGLNLSEVPDETYVFSQAMSNLQVSFVKYYNFIHKRSGSLMAGRFGRKLIETEDKMNSWVERLNNGRKNHCYPAKWAAKGKLTCVAMTSKWLYQDNDESNRRDNTVYRNVKELNLGGCFLNLPAYKLESSERYFKMRFNQLFGPHPGNFF